MAACGIVGQPEERVVISVGKRNITLEELKRDIKRITFEMGITDQEVEYAINPLVNKIVDHYLILEYGKEKQIVVSEHELGSAVKEIKKDYPEKVFHEVLLHGYLDFKEWKEKLEQQLLIKKIIKKISESIAPITAHEIKTYFDSHQDEFRRPAMVKFRQIVTRTRAEADRIRKRLAKGEDMSELAMKYSISPEGKNGGNVSWIARGELEESMGKGLFALSVGKIGPVVETPYGFHIFEALSKRPEGFQNLHEAMAEIETTLFLQKEELFYKKWLKELRSLFPVKVNQELLKTLELG